MNDFKRVKGHNGFDHRIKKTEIKNVIDTDYVKNNRGSDIIIFLCSENYTGNYENLPDNFYTKMMRCMNYLESLGFVISIINSELFQKLEGVILEKVAKQKIKGNNVKKLIDKIYTLSNKTEESINEIISSYTEVDTVQGNVKSTTSDILNKDCLESDFTYTPYQIICNESKLKSSDGLQLLQSLSSKFMVPESKYLKIKDTFYALMLKNNKDFMLNNIYIRTSKTYLSDELLEMFSVYVYIESKSNRGVLNLGIIQGIDTDNIDENSLVREYLTQPGKISIKESNIMGMKKIILSINS